MLRATMNRSMVPLAHAQHSFTRCFHLSSAKSLDYVPTRHQLPTPPLVVGAMQKSRLREHYERTLAADMMYMMYEPESGSTSSKDSPALGDGARETDRVLSLIHI